MFLILWALTSVKSIHDVDFCNLNYAVEGQIVHLQGGRADVPNREDEGITRIKAGLDEVLYGDLTGDGREEAVVSLGYNLGGTGNFTFANIYGIVGGRLIILGQIEGGDRAYGSFHNIAIERTRLRVVRNWTTTCMVCTEGYETTWWKWNGKRLTLVKRQRVKVATEDLQEGRRFTSPCLQQ
jgi:hypothetical protein